MNEQTAVFAVEILEANILSLLRVVLVLLCDTLIYFSPTTWRRR